MKIKAFTLVEVLVVIVIIGVIMLITRPIAISIFENAKEKTFSVMVEKIADAGENYITDYEVEYGRPLYNTVIEITEEQSGNNILRLSGDLPESAIISIEDGKAAVAVYDNGMCGIKNKEDAKATIKKSSKQECTLDGLLVYGIVASDITIFKGNDIDLLEGVYFKHYNDVIDTEITYTTDFDYNTVGTYTVLYNTIYDNQSYDATRIINVIDDSTPPILTVSHSSDNYIAIIARDDESGLSNENVYQYYLSTSSDSLVGGEWTNYSSGRYFELIMQNSGMYYLWVYPIKDKSGNVNDNKTFGTPYVIDSFEKKEQYELTINLDGGNSIQNLSHVLYAGEQLNLVQPTKNGCTFLEWDVTGIGSSINGTTFTMGTSNATVTANWNCLHTLTINLDGGSINQDTNYTMFVNDTIQLGTPMKVGYTFDYWEINGNGSSINGTTFTMGIEDTVITAKWQINPYVLTVNPNGGTWNGSTSSQEFEMYYNDTKTISNPTRTGYTFDGWTLSGEASSFQNGTFTMGTGNATLTAIWVGTSYEITYNCNGGSGSTAKSTHTYGVEKNLTKNGCYKLTTGSNGMIYIMEGWATTSSATTPIYNDEQSVLDVGNVTLYAVWKNLFTYSGSKYVINDGNGKWRVKFLSTGSKQLVMNYTTNIDIFLVGGGSALGGGGKTKTVKGQEVQAGTYSIVVGAGGTVSSTNGGTTSAFGQSVSGGNGTSGGSGAGGSGYVGHGGDGGAYGSDGGMYKSDGSVGPGSGQGTTTCEFGQGTTSGCYSGVDAYGGGGGGGAGSGCTACVGSDPRKDLVAEGGAGGAGGGGNGSGTSCTNGTANTGGGAGLNRRGAAGCSGGSGIVIIRNAR